MSGALAGLQIVVLPNASCKRAKTGAFLRLVVPLLLDVIFGVVPQCSILFVRRGDRCHAAAVIWREKLRDMDLDWKEAQT